MIKYVATIAIGLTLMSAGYVIDRVDRVSLADVRLPGR